MTDLAPLGRATNREAEEPRRFLEAEVWLSSHCQVAALHAASKRRGTLGRPKDQV